MSETSRRDGRPASLRSWQPRGYFQSPIITTCARPLAVTYFLTATSSSGPHFHDLTMTRVSVACAVSPESIIQSPSSLQYGERRQ